MADAALGNEGTGSRSPLSFLRESFPAVVVITVVVAIIFPMPTLLLDVLLALNLVFSLLVLFFSPSGGGVAFGEGFYLPSRAEVVLQSGPAARLFSKEKVFCGGCFYFFLQVGSVAFGEGFFSPSAGGGFASRRVTFFVWTKKVTKKSHSPRALRGSSSVAS